jgi:hypothetical protein
MNVVSVKKIRTDVMSDNDVLKEELVLDPVSGKKTVLLRTINLDSADFGAAFTKVFQSNVTKARRESKRRLSAAHVNAASGS